MGQKIFGVDIAGIVANTFKGNLNTGILIKVSYADRDSNNLTAANQLTNNYNFDGIAVKYDDRLINGTSIMSGDRQIIIIAGTLQSGIVPEVSDQITIDGSTYTLIVVDIDPAEATYTCQGRR